jgi:hypothetical protein
LSSEASGNSAREKDKNQRKRALRPAGENRHR